MKHGIRNLIIGTVVIPASTLFAQDVDVDVNWNIEYIVGGVSDFGRERHITLHSNLVESDWDGEEDKMDYLFNDLNAYFGRDNGSAGWKFKATAEDPNRPNHPDLSAMKDMGTWLKAEYDTRLDRRQYEPRCQEMIMGTNPHPLYPTLSWNPQGSTWTGWQPKDVETSTEWVVGYLDHFFRREGDATGEKIPKYWEVINEPDMKLMTGQFMVSSWESLWNYHNLVAEGVRERMGDEAPLIGGMTWGLHDLYKGDSPRFSTNHYYDMIVGNNPSATNGAKAFRDASGTEYPRTGVPWEQWDVVWKGFIDHAGPNMDFYAVHLYDWPVWETPGKGALRSGGAVEATLDALEWYDVHSTGISNRKPVVISEYGAVGGYEKKTGLDPKRQHWEDLKPFSAMLMQFLERPDYIVKSMPFAPIKAEWGNYYVGDDLHRYSSRMMDETSDGSGVWEWTEFIKFFELWSEVDGIRVDTKASDLDIQVDAYVKDDTGFLIINNLEPVRKEIRLHAFGANNNLLSHVRIKHLYLDETLGNDGQPVLSDDLLETAPGGVTIGANATMILAYQFTNPVVLDEAAHERKFYGESLSGTVPHRLQVANGNALTAHINDVVVPTGPAEATLRISGLFQYDFVNNPDPRNQITINGRQLDYLADWRGEGSGRWFGTLEVPVPKGYLKRDNTIVCKVLNNVTYTTVTLLVSEFSETPGRSGVGANIPVRGIRLASNALSLLEQRTGSLKAGIGPVNASDKRMLWSSSHPEVATVDSLGLITAVSAGVSRITVKNADGRFSASAKLTVNPFVPFEVSDVRLYPSARVIRVGEMASLSEIVLPAAAADKSVTWHSDNTSVATVDTDGLVTAIAEGQTIVSVVSIDGGYTDTTVVTVPPPIPVRDVGISPSEVLITTRETAQLVERIQPKGAANVAVSWHSLDDAIASVDSAGLVMGVSPGIVQIVATSADGGFAATNETTVFSVVPGGLEYIIEAENFIKSGGVSNSVNGINWVQSNDWAEYNIHVPADGIYKLEYLIATANEGTAIEFFLDGVSLAKDEVPNTGDWNTYVTLAAKGCFKLSEGAHSVRIVAASPAAWQWNLDKMSLTRIDR